MWKSSVEGRLDVCVAREAAGGDEQPFAPSTDHRTEKIPNDPGSEGSHILLARKKCWGADERYAIADADAIYVMDADVRVNFSMPHFKPGSI